MNGPYALITTAVSADLVRPEVSMGNHLLNLKLFMTDGGQWMLISIYMMSLLQQGTHESLRGNSRALSTVTAIIDGTGSIGMECQKCRDFKMASLFSIFSNHHL